MNRGPLKKICIIIILSTWLARISYPASNHRQESDYLIIEKPAALKIYNKYEQKIDPAEAGLFKPFCALHLIDINITLSDNFTLADRIEMEGEYFYLLKNNRHTFDLNQATGYLKEFRGVQAIEDTVVVGRDDRIYLQSPATMEKTGLPAGTLLRRIFITGNRTYIQILDVTRRYGWCNLSVKTDWYRYTRLAATINLDEVLEQIQPVFDRYNLLYQRTFQYFNQQTGAQRAIPYWQVELKNMRITAKLLNLSGTALFQYSLPYLINEIHQHLLNTNLQITQTRDGVEIR